ncbi:MAG: hypothetical protein GF410_07640, partial [Chitinivibrionales bacterium]|nr:hypothetical protein [Chitinivibrionales bacterium]
MIPDRHKLRRGPLLQQFEDADPWSLYVAAGDPGGVNLRATPGLDGDIIETRLPGFTVHEIDPAQRVESDGLLWLHVMDEDGNDFWMANTVLLQRVPANVAPLGTGETPTIIGSASPTGYT